MRALVVHNPTAGDGTLSAETLCAAIEISGYVPLYHSLVEADFLKALDEPVDLIVAAGGDGTAGKVLRHMPDRSIPAAIVPSGTANNIARSLGITDAPERYARHLANAPKARLDMGLAAGPWGRLRFVEGMGFGAFAGALRREANSFDSEDMSSIKARLKAGRRTLRKSILEAAAEGFEIEIDGEMLSGDFLFVEVMNIGCTGPGLMLSPEARSGDQLLDVVYLPAEGREAMLAWLDGGCEEASMPVWRLRGQSIVVKTEGGALRRDDNVWLDPLHPSMVRMEIEPEGLQILVPRL